MAISFSRPDPSSPAAVADASFPTARRGFDQNEVRDFLRMVAAELARLQERERYLDYEMRSLRQQRANLPAELDDEAIARLLGEETARIVQVARESSSAIRIKAEEAAERTIREATETAQQVRDAAETEAAQRLKDAEADAEAEIAMAKQQGREMVEEARAYRERALSELAKRRDLARQQIDQLLHGRDRLVQAFERARLVAVDVVAELTPLGELDEYVNLSPTTGPVPMMVPKSRLGDASSIGDDALALRAAAAEATAGDAAATSRTRPMRSRSAEPTMSSRSAEPTMSSRSAEPTIRSRRTARERATPPAPSTRCWPTRRRHSTPTTLRRPRPSRRPPTCSRTPRCWRSRALRCVRRPMLLHRPRAPTRTTTTSSPRPTSTTSSPACVPSRSRPAGPDSENPPEPTAFERRDEALTPLIVVSARKLKRVLADEQNAVLDRLRRPEAVRTIDDVLADPDSQSATYFGAIAAEVLAAAEVGADSMGGAMLDVSSLPSGGHGVLAPVEESLREELVAPLRKRLADRIANDDGDNEAITKSVRAVYREWKTKHIDNHLDDLLRLAHGRGVFAALTPGEPCRWTVDPSGGACSDCDDNSLQGAVAAGERVPDRAPRRTRPPRVPLPARTRRRVAFAPVRRASSLPRHRSRWQSSGRIAIIAIGVFLVVVVIFGRALARFYVDLLWHDGLGQSSVFWTMIRAKLFLFAGFYVLFALIIGANLVVADRLAPSHFPANVHPYVERFHDVFGRRLRLYRYIVAALLALALAAPTTSHWQSWLLFRHRQTFGATDGQFGVDVGFYVFELPFLSFVLDWLFIATIVVLIVTAITHLLNGGVVFASPVPTVSHGTRGHLAVLLAVLAALKAADYWVQRYETTNERRGFVQGATYAVVHAQLPALILLMVVALVTSGLYLSTLRTQSFRLPLVASAVWLVLAVLADYAYPAAVQALVVKPNQASREAPFIERNVLATRDAMGITNVTRVDVDFQQLEASDVENDLQPLRDVRLLNPNEMLSRFQIDRQGVDAGLVIDDLDVDRYDLDGPTAPTVSSRCSSCARAGRQPVGEPQLAGPAPHQHARVRRGDGAGRARAIAWPAHLPGCRAEAARAVLQPDAGGVRGGRHRREAERLRGQRALHRDQGRADVVVRAPPGVRLAFMDYNLIGSGAINDDSQMLWVRNVRDRVEKLAPFLSYDGDPYPVVLNGRVLWVIDAYTSTSRYPYAEAVGDDIRLSENSGIPRDANYVRNSVKAVVDAYDGTVSMYIVDDTDPIVRAWSHVFPSLFSPASEMPDGLRDHLRYPEDLFRVQTNVYSKYQLQPADFFERDGAWSVAQAPPVVAVRAPRRRVRTWPRPRAGQHPTQRTGHRVVQRPLHPVLHDVRRGPRLRAAAPVRAVLARRPAHCATGLYDRVERSRHVRPAHVYQVDGSGDQPAGPLTVANLAVSTPDISELITLQSQGGAQVRFGDLQLVPIQRTDSDGGGEGLLYVRPLYLTVQRTGAIPSESTYQYVVVSTDDGTAVYAARLGDALGQLFPGLDVDLGERLPGSTPEVVPGLPVDNGATGGVTADGSVTPVSTPEQLLTAADRLLRQAGDDLRVNGDLGAYQEKVDQATELVTQALTAMGAPLPSESAPALPADSAPTGSIPG